MEYKRVTTKGNGLRGIDGKLINQRQKPIDVFGEAFNIAVTRLAELEDKIENGTLIELPCKVWDTVYQLDNGGKIYEATIVSVEIYKGKPYYETCGVDFDNTAIGKSVFLTKAEAEEKIRELKGKV